MIITNKINAYIHQNGEYRMDAVQGDTARVLELSLYCGAEKWPVPQGAAVQVRFRKSDGTGGNYDTLPDGTRGYMVADNVVFVALAPQVLTVAGETEVQVLLAWDQGEMACFTIRINVQADPSRDTLESEDYVNLTFWVHQQVNQYLQEAQDELRELYAVPGALVVHVQKKDGVYSAGKTYGEILAAGPDWTADSAADGRPVYCVLWNDMNREYLILSLTAYDADSRRLVFSCTEGTDRIWVEITPNGINAGQDVMARKEDVPDVLPNPCTLTINGKIYDGTEMVDVDTRAVIVTVYGKPDGSYEANMSLEELDYAYQQGRELCCDYTTRLRLTGKYGAEAAGVSGYVFKGVDEGNEYLVMIGTDGIKVTVTKLVPSALPNPWPLTVNGQTYDGSRPVNVSTSTDFRLIEKRVLSEMTNLVRFSDMALSSFRVYLSVPQGGASASVGAAAYIGNKQVGYAWLASMISNGSSRVAMVEGKQQGGLVTYRNTTPANTTANTQIYSQSPVCAEATGPFSRIEFAVGSGGEFPVGTEIQLWGTD